MFHHFHGSGHKHSQGALSAEQFETILKYVGLENILKPQEWLRRAQEHSLGKRDFCITFDDGLKSQFDVCLPVLDKYDLQAFWFVYSAPFENILVPIELCRRFRNEYFDTIEEYYRAFFERHRQACDAYFDRRDLEDFSSRYRAMFPFYSENDIRYRYLRDKALTTQEYRALIESLAEERGVSLTDLAENLWLTNEHLRQLGKSGHNVGLHSFDHPTTMADMPAMDQREQYTKNKDHIERCWQKPVVVAHPCNSYTRETLEILRALGIVCGFRSNMQPPEGRRINASLLEFAREDSTTLLRLASGDCRATSALQAKSY
jgi:peptidoglycan/xylan/chitin deacetylase (PgdA/CDA1 family)